ncbi:MATE family efflux transporter [Sphingomonas sp. ASV193]|uniref:MATE family efflux transporter n=1 Tax=Sphingomonas sp. ASV193 TaxID=3144405 RepID=UPI0032E887E1
MPDSSQPTPAARGAKGRARPNLTEGPIASNLLWFMLPTLGSSILQSLNGSINAIWVGRLLGERALAATSNANAILFLMLAFVFGFGMAATILIGQAFGRRDMDAARRVTGTAFTLFAIVLVAVSTVGYVFTPQILALLATPPDVVPLAVDYLRVIFIGMPAALMLGMLMMAIRGTGDSLTPLWFMILSVILDSGLNPFFIEGWGPFPKMGIAGSAVTTALANWVALLGLIGWTYLKDLPLRLRGAELAYLKPSRQLTETIVVKGLPMGLQMIVVSGSAMAMLGLVNVHGVDFTAAFGVALQLWTYVQMPAMAVGAAVSTMVAQNIGAGQWERVAKVTRSGIVIVLAITAIMVASLAAADRTVLALFLGSGSPAMPLARHIQLLGTWGYLLFGVMMVLFATVRANGAVVAPLVILTIGLFVVRLSVASFGQRWLGTDALWLSLPVATFVNLVLAIAYYRRGTWRKAHMSVGGRDPNPGSAEPQAA